MSIKLVEFLPGNGYRSFYAKQPKSHGVIDYQNIGRNFSDFLTVPIRESPDYETISLCWEEQVVKSCCSRTTYTALHILINKVNYELNHKGNSRIICEDFINDYGIFVILQDRLTDANCYTIMEVLPVELVAEDTVDSINGYIRKMVLTCRAYYKHGICIADVVGNKDILYDTMEHVLIHHMKLTTNIYTGDDYYLLPVEYSHDTIDYDALEHQFSIRFPHRDAITYMQQGLKYDLDKLSSVIKDLVLMKNCDYSRVVIDSLSGLGTLSGSRIMSILDKLPKIKRLERNDAFTTAVWEDNTVTRLKKSEEDEDDFEKLVFFLILKKLCNNNVHKMHSTLTDYLNTFRDATVDIPKQKEEKAEKKRKAKEEVKQ